MPSAILQMAFFILFWHDDSFYTYLVWSCYNSQCYRIFFLWRLFLQESIYRNEGWRMVCIIQDQALSKKLKSMLHTVKNLLSMRASSSLNHKLGVFLQGLHWFPVQQYNLTPRLKCSSIHVIGFVLWDAHNIPSLDLDIQFQPHRNSERAYRLFSVLSENLHSSHTVQLCS